MRKCFRLYVKPKVQISCAGNRATDQRLCFLCIVQFIYFFNPKFQASSHLLWLYSPVCVGPGGKTPKTGFLMTQIFYFSDQRTLSGLSTRRLVPLSSIGGESMTPQKKLTCSYCDYTCEYKSHLDQHQRVHTGLKPYQCQICSRAFTQKSSLKSHMLVHMRLP